MRSDEGGDECVWKVVEETVWVWKVRGPCGSGEGEDCVSVEGEGTM